MALLSGVGFLTLLLQLLPFPVALAQTDFEEAGPEPVNPAWFWFARPGKTTPEEAVSRLGRADVDYPAWIIEGDVDLFVGSKWASSRGRFGPDGRYERASMLGREVVEVRVLEWPADDVRDVQLVFQRDTLFFARVPLARWEATLEDLARLFGREPRHTEQSYLIVDVGYGLDMWAFPEWGVGYVSANEPVFWRKVVARVNPESVASTIEPRPEERPAEAAATPPDLRAHFLVMVQGLLRSDEGSPSSASDRPSPSDRSGRLGDGRSGESVGRLQDASAAVDVLLEWNPSDAEALELRGRIDSLLSVLGVSRPEDPPWGRQAEAAAGRLAELVRVGGPRTELEEMHDELREVVRRLEPARPADAARYQARADELWALYASGLGTVRDVCDECPPLDVAALVPEFSRARALGAGDYALDQLVGFYAPLVTGDFNRDGTIDVALVGRGSSTQGTSSLFLLIATPASGSSHRRLHYEPLDWTVAALAPRWRSEEEDYALTLSQTLEGEEHDWELVWARQAFQRVPARPE